MMLIFAFNSCFLFYLDLVWKLALNFDEYLDQNYKFVIVLRKSGQRPAKQWDFLMLRYLYRWCAPYNTNHLKLCWNLENWKIEFQKATEFLVVFFWGTLKWRKWAKCLRVLRFHNYFELDSTFFVDGKFKNCKIIALKVSQLKSKQSRIAWKVS